MPIKQPIIAVKIRLPSTEATPPNPSLLGMNSEYILVVAIAVKTETNRTKSTFSVYFML